MSRTDGVPADHRSKQTYVAKTIYFINKNRDDAMGYGMAFLNQLYKSQPDLPPNDALKLLDEARNRFKERLERGGLPKYIDYDKLNFWLDAIGGLNVPHVSKVSDGMKVAFRVGRQLEEDILKPEIAVLSYGEKVKSFLEIREGLTSQVSELYDAAQTNPLAAQSINMAFGNALRAMTFDSEDQIYQSDPEFASNQNIAAIRNALTASNGNITKAQLKELFDDQVQHIFGLMKEDRAILKSIHELDKGNSYVKLKEGLAKAADLHKLHQLQLEAAESSIYLLSTVARFVGDEKLGRVISTSGNSVMQLEQALSKFSVDRVIDDGMAGAVLTANFVSVGLQLLSLFTDDAPSRDKMFLDKLETLKDQVKAVRIEMHERFDRIDRALNDIYEKVDSGLSRIMFQTGIISGNVKSIQADLYKVGSYLNRLDQHLFESIENLSFQPLQESINYFLNYKARLGQLPLHGGKGYADFENVFYTWAKDLSRQSPQVSPFSGRMFDAPSLLDELRYPVEENINYIAKAIGAMAQQDPDILPLTSEPYRLANLNVWALAAQSYVRLASDWPEYFLGSATFLDRLKRIRDVGEELKQALRTIVCVETKNRLRANYSLFDKLIDDYEQKQNTVKEQYFKMEAFYITNLLTTLSGDARKQHFYEEITFFGDIYGYKTGAAQPTSYYPQIKWDEVKITSYDSETGQGEVIIGLREPPRYWKYLITEIDEKTGTKTERKEGREFIPFEIPSQYRLAELLMLGEFSLTGEGAWVDIRKEYLQQSAGTFLNTYGKLQFTITGKFMQKTLTGETEEKTIFSRRLTSKNEKQIDHHLPNGTVTYKRDAVKDFKEVWSFYWDAMDYEIPITLKLPYQSLDDLHKEYQAGAQDLWRIATELGADGFVHILDKTEAESALKEISAKIEERLRDFQRGFYSEVKNLLTDNPNNLGDVASSFKSAIKELSGQKAFLEALITLGMPRSLEENDSLRSYIYGSMRLLDHERLLEICNDKLITGEKHPDQDLSRMELDSYAAALRGTLTSILDSIDQYRFTEWHSSLEFTLGRLEELRLMQLRALSESKRLSITGRVIDSTGIGIPGVTLARTGISTRDDDPVSVTTDHEGFYIFPNLTAGECRITAMKADYGLTPQSVAVWVESDNQTEINFSGHVVPSVVGRIVNNVNDGVPNVEVILHAGDYKISVKTDGNGYYGIGDLPKGTYTVSPVLQGYFFKPIDYGVTRNLKDISPEPYHATIELISKSVTEVNFKALPDVYVPPDPA